MFVLVDYNKNYKEILTELNKHNQTAITLFKLNLNGKDQIKKQLEEIKNLKTKLKPKYSAIQVSIEKLENSSVGVVNSLKQEFDLVIGLGGLNKTNRFFLEDSQIDFIQDPQNSIFKSKMDFIHHFNSGLNQVLGAAAKQKQIGLFISLNFTSNYPKIVAKEIGRINQNIILARKYSLPVYIHFLINCKQQIKSEKELKAISTLFNTSTNQSNQITKILEQKIQKNKFKKSEKYIAEGIKIE